MSKRNNKDPRDQAPLLPSYLPHGPTRCGTTPLLDPPLASYHHLPSSPSTFHPTSPPPLSASERHIGSGFQEATSGSRRTLPFLSMSLVRSHVSKGYRATFPSHRPSR